MLKYVKEYVTNQLIKLGNAALGYFCVIRIIYRPVIVTASKCTVGKAKVSEVVYQQRLNSSERAKKRKVENVSTASLSLVDTEEMDSSGNVTSCAPTEIMEGRRIVELAVLGKKLWCTVCKQVLSLQNIENETRRGLGSILVVRCHVCLMLNTVETNKQHSVGEDRRSFQFDVNSKAALGILHAGMGWTQLNKLLACLNIPPIAFYTFKKYEREVGPVLETVSKESCEEAARLERDLTIKKVEDIEKIL